MSMFFMNVANFAEYVFFIKSKDWIFILRNCKLHRNRWVSLILLRFARLKCLAAILISHPQKLVKGCVGPCRSAQAMPWLQ